MSTAKPTESELIARAQAGDDTAFGILLSTYKDKLRASAFSAFRAMHREDFDDCWQNASLKMWAKIRDFRGDASCVTWMFAILKNEILSMLKKKSLQTNREVSISKVNNEGEELGYDGLIDSQLTDTAMLLMEKQERVAEYKALLQEALAKLKPIHSEVIRMALEEGKSYKEIASELGIPIGSVMSRLHCARKHAQQIIENLCTTTSAQ